MRHTRRAAGPQPSRPADIYLVAPYGVRVRNTSGPGRDKWATLVERARTAAGLTKVALAGRLGVDRATVTRWEQGITRPESADVVQRFADLLGIDLEDALAAAGLRPTGEPERPAPPPMPREVVKLLALLADPDTPPEIQAQVRATLEFLANLADSLPGKAAPRRRRGA